MKTFWILWNPNGQRPPTARFTSFNAAKETAAKMQIQIGPGTMYIMKMVGGVYVEQVSTFLTVENK